MCYINIQFPGEEFYILVFMKFKELIKLLAKYLKPYKKLVWWCVFLSTFASVVSAIIPVVYGRLVDEAVSPDVNLKIVGLVLVGWLIFVSLSNWMSRYVSLKGGELGGRVYQNFIKDVYYHYIQLPIDFHKDKKSGSQMDKISRAGESLWNMVDQVAFYVFPNFLTAFIAIGLMYYLEWKMATILVVILALYTIATLAKTKPIVKAQQMINKAWETTWGYIYDTVGNIEVVKSNVKEQEETKQVYSYLDQAVNKMVIFFKKWRDLSVWQNNIQGFGFVIVFGVAIYLLTQGQITAGILVTFVGYVNLVFRPFNQLADSYRRIQRGLAIIGRVMKLLQEKKELYQTGKYLDEIKGKIEFKNVSFGYSKKQKSVLRQVSFQVNSGEIIALVGESGAGKSTTLKLISRYYHADKGKILLDGENIEDLDLSFLREQIAIVPQEVSLFNDTLKKNLVYAKGNTKESEIIEALQAANAWDFVSEFPKKLKQRVGERGIKLSTGQKQRIAIARAILRNPKILILDEATSALDSISERLVQEALKRLIAGRTTFIIAHRLSTITHADKILVFEHGRLVEQGKHDELVKKQGAYWRLYKEQKF